MGILLLLLYGLLFTPVLTLPASSGTQCKCSSEVKGKAPISRVFSQQLLNKLRKRWPPQCILIYTATKWCLWDDVIITTSNNLNEQVKVCIRMKGGDGNKLKNAFQATPPPSAVPVTDIIENTEPFYDVNMEVMDIKPTDAWLALKYLYARKSGHSSCWVCSHLNEKTMKIPMVAVPINISRILMSTPSIHYGNFVGRDRQLGEIQIQEIVGSLYVPDWCIRGILTTGDGWCGSTVVSVTMTPGTFDKFNVQSVTRSLFQSSKKKSLYEAYLNWTGDDLPHQWFHALEAVNNARMQDQKGTTVLLMPWPAPGAAAAGADLGEQPEHVLWPPAGQE